MRGYKWDGTEGIPSPLIIPDAAADILAARLGACKSSLKGLADSFRTLADQYRADGKAAKTEFKATECGAKATAYKYAADRLTDILNRTP